MNEKKILGDLFKLRDPESLALVCSEGNYLVKDVLKITEEISQELKIFNKINRAQSFLIDSSEPIVFISALFAIIENGLTAVCWDGDSNPRNLAELTSSVALIGPNKDKVKDKYFYINDLQTDNWALNHPGNLVVMTSGSTGSPKGVSLNTESVICNAFLAGKALELSKKNLDCWIIDIELNLMSALSHFFMAWQNNLPLFCMTNFSENAKRKLFKKKKFGFGGAPLQISKLASTILPVDGEGFLVSSGDFLSKSLVDGINLRFPNISVASFYGLTEMSGRFCYANYSNESANKGSVGIPLDAYEVKIKDQDNQGVGEILIKSDLTFNGYYRLNRIFEEHNRTDWFRTGDLASIDQTGLYWLKGRSDDVFKVSGKKVDRQSIENCLVDVFKGIDYCVLPVKHSLMGTCPALFIASEDLPSSPKLIDIVAVIKEKLPSRYIPIHYYSLDELPKLPNGKLDKQFLINNHSELNRYRA